MIFAGLILKRDIGDGSTNPLIRLRNGTKQVSTTTCPSNSLPRQKIVIAKVVESLKSRLEKLERHTIKNMAL